jgi:hypothetical protein
MSDPAVGPHELPDSRRRTDQIASMVVRQVYADMSGRPVDQVYRALNARLHASKVALPAEEVWEYADSISDGAAVPRRS